MPYLSSRIEKSFQRNTMILRDRNTYLGPFGRILLSLQPSGAVLFINHITFVQKCCVIIVGLMPPYFPHYVTLDLYCSRGDRPKPVPLQMSAQPIYVHLCSYIWKEISKYAEIEEAFRFRLAQKIMQCFYWPQHLLTMARPCGIYCIYWRLVSAHWASLCVLIDDLRHHQGQLEKVPRPYLITTLTASGRYPPPPSLHGSRSREN